MKTSAQLVIACILLLSACNINKTSINTTKKTIVSNTEPSYDSKFNPAEQNIEGDWTLIGVDSYRSIANAEKEAGLTPGDVIWNFVGENGMGTLHIRNYAAPSELIEELPNKMNFWTEDCLLQLDEQKYIYKITEIFDEDGNRLARELTLRNNLDISIPDGGATLRFRSLDAYWACGTINEGSNARPQWASLINGIVVQAYIPEDNIEGKFKLIEYQAFAPDEYLPQYNGEDIVWEFKNHTLKVYKENKEINNDYSLESGEYQVWKDRCLMQIDKDIYYWELQDLENKNGKKKTMLILNSGTEPGIADEEQYYYFERV